MNDWTYVAIGYGGTMVVLGGYCLRLVQRSRRSRSSRPAESSQGARS